MEKEILPARRARENVLNTIERLSRIAPDRVALIDEEREVTYNRLFLEICATQEVFNTHYGVKRGDRVGLLIENNIASAVAFLAIIRLGAIAVIINTKLAEPEVDYIINDSTPNLIVVGYEKSLPLVEGKAPIHLLSAKNNFPTTFMDGDYPAAQYIETDCAVIIYTSGTTGRPKGAKITHGNISHSVDSYTTSLNLTGNDSTIIVVPLFYVTGLIAQLMVFLGLGAKIVILRRLDETEALRLINKHRITLFHSVATVYLRLLDGLKKAAPGWDLSCLRLALCGGGPITTSLIKQVKSYLPTLDFRRIYGLTESTSAGTVMPQDVLEILEKPVSSGLPMRWVELKVVDEAGNVVAPGVPGELLIKSPVIVTGYWNNPEADKHAFIDGWFRTGDVAKIDEDGFVYILDRMKDMINRGGEKIFSSEVETVIASYPGIKEVAVVGIPDNYYGETVKAFIVEDDGTELSKDKILAYAKERLAKYKVPAEIEFLSELPKSPVGKVMKKVLRDIGRENG